MTGWQHDQFENSMKQHSDRADITSNSIIKTECDLDS